MEFIVTAATFLLVIAACWQGGLWYMARQAALASAQEGLRAARAQHGSPGAGQSAAMSYATQVGGAHLNAPGAQVSEGADQTIVVRVTGRVPSFVPGLNINISREARGPKERWTTPGAAR
ncbi:TadE/TadG family type IV pilus assembly protein [Actinomadura sp. 6N118]|uniref:TadE/TadG family type IV pilus assembly protein n=1 Tax=Actinomadura sp. 6N118 TaxID=3375151 RepID=UPI0037B64677